MSTRAQVRFATREEGVSFSEHPSTIHAQFYVHSDGYPEGLGVEIAESLISCQKICNWEVEELHHEHTDLEYIYYVWQKLDDSTWISIFKVNTNATYCRECGHFGTGEGGDKCIFVGRADKLIGKYKLNTNEDG